MKRLLAIISWCLVAIKAQIFHFDNEPVPQSKSLRVTQEYFVFGKDEAPDKSAGESYVKFRDLTVKSTTEDRDDASLKSYRGIQLSLLRYDSFLDQVDPSRMCSMQEDIAAGLSKTLDQLIIKRDAGQSFEDAHVYRHQLSFQEKTPDQKMEVTKSGMYILVASNCGDFYKAVISGDVVVKSPHGFLPANEHEKMPFYAGMCGVYALLGIMWALLCVRWWKELLNFHMCIGIVLFLGMCECLLWYVFLVDWNTQGIRSSPFFGSAVMASAMRTTLSFMLVLLASLGWGVTRPVLDSSTMCRIWLLSLSYILSTAVQEIVLSSRYYIRSEFSPFVLLCLLSNSLMSGCIFYWVFSALTSLTETLKAQSQTQKLSIFQKLWWVLTIAGIFAAIVLLVKIFAFSSQHEHWREEWLITDCAPQVGFAFVLISIMFLFAPHEDSQRLAYSTQLDGNEGGELADSSIWADEGVVDQENDDDSFWASTKKDPSKAPPDIIGAGNSCDAGGCE